MGKKIEFEKITAVGCIHYNGGVYLPGASFDCDPAEAERLIADGEAIPAVATAASNQSAPSGFTPEQDELLAQIAAAASEEALSPLLPQEEPADAAFAAALKEAVQKRLAELAA